MKRLLSIFLLFTLLLVSCGKSDETVELIIPATTEAVAIINLPTLSKKLDKAVKDEALTQLESIMGDSNVSAEQEQIIKELLHDPVKSGLSVEDKVFFYKGEDSSFGWIAKVADRKKLEELLSSLEIISKENLEKKGELSILTAVGNTIGVWDDSRILLTLNENKNIADVKSQAIAQFSQKEEESILADKVFKETNKKCKDMGFYQRVKISEVGASVNFTLAVNMSFEKGYAEADANIYYADKKKVFISGINKIEGKHRKYLEGADFVLQTNIDTKSILEDLKEAGQSNPMVSGVVSQIEGDITFMFREGGRYDFFVSIKDEKETEAILDGLLSLFLPIKSNGGEYVIDMPEGKGTLSIKDKVLHFSHDRGLFRNDILTKLDIETDAIFSVQGNAKIIAESLKDAEVLNIIEGYKLAFKDDSTAHARVDFIDKSTNSINVIINQILENKDKARRFMN